jgi:hypothetical protein
MFPMPPAGHEKGEIAFETKDSKALRVAAVTSS